MPTVVKIALLMLICPVLHAAWTLPVPAEQELLDKALAPRHREFDAKENMLLSRIFNPGYHSHLATGSLAHSTKAALDYALELLDTGKPENLQRATRVLSGSNSVKRCLISE